MQQQQQQLMMQQQQQPHPRYHAGSMMQYVLSPPPSYASSPALAASQSTSGAVGSDVTGVSRVPPTVDDTDEDAARLLLGAAIGVSKAQTGTEGPQPPQSQSLPLQDPVRSPDGVKEEERVRAAAAVANTVAHSKQH
jgi:hypothetical protein